MGGPFTNKLRTLAADMSQEEYEFAESVAAALDQVARAIELLEAELEDAKVAIR